MKQAFSGAALIVVVALAVGYAHCKKQKQRLHLWAVDIRDVMFPPSGVDHTHREAVQENDPD